MVSSVYVELLTHPLGLGLLAGALLLLAWMVFGGAREGARKPAPTPDQGLASRKAAASTKEAPVPTPPARPVKPVRAPKAIVWEVPRANDLDDDDITVLRAIPVLDDAAEVTVESTSRADEGDDEEARPSRIELSYEEGAELDEVTASSARILLYAGGDSDRGRVRARNEDSLLLMPERSLFAIADGMGGHRGGEIASSVAIDTLRDAFSRSAFEAPVQAEHEVPRRARELAAAVQMTNECVRSMALADRELHDMGTTLVAARFSPNKQRLYVGHVGDSRCYRLRRGALRQLTSDHTMASLGMKGPHAQDLYQAVGVNPDLTIDLIVDKPQENDVYLLCSDGLSKMVQDDVIRDVLVAQEDLESALYTLIEMANDRGGKDNVTVILVKVLARNFKQAIESFGGADKGTPAAGGATVPESRA